MVSSTCLMMFSAFNGRSHLATTSGSAARRVRDLLRPLSSPRSSRSPRMNWQRSPATCASSLRRFDSSGVGSVALQAVLDVLGDPARGCVALIEHEPLVPLVLDQVCGLAAERDRAVADVAVGRVRVSAALEPSDEAGGESGHACKLFLRDGGARATARACSFAGLSHAAGNVSARAGTSESPSDVPGRSYRFSQDRTRPKNGCHCRLVISTRKSPTAASSAR